MASSAAVGRSILYLEDSPDDAARARQILESAGFCVEVVDTPSKALGRLRRGRYVALLIEQRLRRFEGSEIVLQLRDLEIPLPPTYLVSGVGDRDVEDRAIANGAAGIIHKGAEPAFAADLLLAVGVAPARG